MTRKATTTTNAYTAAKASVGAVAIEDEGTPIAASRPHAQPRPVQMAPRTDTTATDPEGDVELTDADRVFLDYLAEVAVRLYLGKLRGRE
jgi:hypothetical protein